MRALVGAAILVMSSFANAGWIHTTAKIDRLVSYAHTETILVYLEGNGADVSECSNKNAFAISSTMSEEGRARMFAMLLAAQTSNKKVTVSFLNEGGCEPWFSTPNVYRKITLVTTSDQ